MPTFLLTSFFAFAKMVKIANQGGYHRLKSFSLSLICKKGVLLIKRLCVLAQPMRQKRRLYSACIRDGPVPPVVSLREKSKCSLQNSQQFPPCSVVWINYQMEAVILITVIILTPLKCTQYAKQMKT